MHSFLVLVHGDHMIPTCLLSLRVLFNDGDNGIHDGFLVLKSSLLPQHGGKVGHQDVVFPWKLDAHRADGLHHNRFELIGNF